MLRIHRCQLTINGSDALRDGSTISMNRLKQILSTQLRELENLPGRVHIKKLTLDLGDFQNLSINQEFIERFEETCSNFCSKMMELHLEEQSNISEEEREQKHELIGAMYDVEQTTGIQNALYLIESESTIKDLLNWDAFQKKYMILFQNPLSLTESKRIKEILQRFSIASDLKDNLNTVKSELVGKGRKHLFSSNEIDFVLAKMDQLSIDSNWLNAMERSFLKEFGRTLPEELKSHLKRVFDSFEFSLNPDSNRNDKRIERLSSVKQELIGFFKSNQKNTSSKELIELIEASSNLDEKRWFYTLLKEFKREHGREMSLADQKSLLDFNTWKNKPTWHELPKNARSGLLSKLKKFSKYHESVNTQKRSQLFSTQAYQFILDHLEKFELNAAWFPKITRAYELEFKSKLPQFISDLLHDFASTISSDSSSKIERSPRYDLKTSWVSRAITYFQTHTDASNMQELLQEFDRIKPRNPKQWNLAFEKFIQNRTGESITSTRFDELRTFETDLRLEVSRLSFDKNRKKLERMLDLVAEKLIKTKGETNGNLKAQTSLILDLLDEVRFDASWRMVLAERFAQFSQSHIPKAFLACVERFMEKYVQAELRSIPDFSRSLSSPLISIESLRVDLVSLGEMQGVTELMEMLPAPTDPQKFVDLDALSEGFQAVYNRKMPDSLKDELVKRTSPSALWQREKDKAFLRFVEKRLELSGVNLTSKEMEFVHSAWNQSLFGGFWIAPFLSEFKRKFNHPFPSELIKLVEELDAQLQKDSSITGQGGVLRNENESRQKLNRTVVLQSEMTKQIKRFKRIKSNQSSELELNFILDFLEKYGLGADWKSKLALAFKQEFNNPIPRTIQVLLDEVTADPVGAFSAEEVSSTDSIDSVQFAFEEFTRMVDAFDDFGWSERLRNVLQTLAATHAFISLQELIARFELTTNESFPIAVQMNVRVVLRNYHNQRLLEVENELKRRVLSKLHESKESSREGAFMSEMIQKFPFDASWFSTVKQNYRRDFGKKMPQSLHDEISEFIRVAQQELDRLESSTYRVEPETEYFSKELVAFIDLHDDPSTSERIALLTKKNWVNPKTAWWSELMAAYHMEFKEELPSKTQKLLLRFSAQRSTVSWDAVPIEHRKLFLDKLRPALVENQKMEEGIDGKGIDFTKHFSFILSLLESTPLSAAWYSTISKAYAAEFNAPVPGVIEELLFDFSRDLFSRESKVDSVDPSQAFEFQRTKKEVFEANSTSEQFFEELKNELELHVDDLTFERIISLIDSEKLNSKSSWRNQLMTAYRTEFQEELPLNTQELLMQLGAQGSLNSWDVVPIEKRKSLLEKLRPAFSERNKQGKDQEGKEIDFEKHLSFILSLLESTELNAAWYSTISKAFSTEFNTPLPKAIERLLLDFFRDLTSRESKVDSVDPSQAFEFQGTKKEVFEANSTSEQFFEELKNELVLHVDDLTFERIISLIDSEKLNSKSSWRNQLMTAYRTEFQEELPLNTQELLMQFSAQGSLNSWDAVPIEKRKSLLEKLRPAFSERNKQGKDQEGKEIDFEKHLSFILSLLESTELNAAWYSTISKAFSTEFNTPLPKSIEELLLDFSRDIFSRESTIETVDPSQVIEFQGAKDDVSITNSENERFFDELKKELKGHVDTLTFERIISLMNSEKLNSKSSWRNQLITTYRTEFQEELPLKTQELLMQFAAQGSRNSWDAVPIEERKSLLEKLRPAFMDQQKEERPNGKEIDFEKQVSFILSLLESTELNAAWYSSISSNYSAEFNAALPKVIAQLLLDFSSSLYTQVPSFQGVTEESELRSDVLHHYLMHLLQTVDRSVDSASFQQWFKSEKIRSDRDWLNVLQEKYSNEVGEMTSELKSILVTYAASINRDAIGDDGTTKLESIRETISAHFKRQADNESVEVSDPSEMAFLLEWIEKQHFSLASLMALENDFSQRFHRSLDRELRLELSAFCFKMEVENRSLSTTSNEDIGNQRSSQFTRNSEREMVALKKKWWMAKLEQLVLGWLDLTELTGQYRAFFGSPMPLELKEIAESAVNSAKRIAGQNSNIIEEIRQYLRNKEMDESVNELIAFFNEPITCTQSDWFKVILETYKTRFNRSMPFQLQQHLIGFAGQLSPKETNDKSIDSLSKQASIKEEISANWQSFLVDKLHEANGSNFRLLEAQLTFVQKFVHATILTPTELDLLEALFEREFNEDLPKAWRAQLMNDPTFKTISNRVDDPVLNENSWKLLREDLFNYLEQLPNTSEVNLVLSFIKGVPRELGQNWFQELLALYLETNHVKMPPMLQGILLRFMQQRSGTRAKSEQIEVAKDAEVLTDLIAKTQESVGAFLEMNAKAIKTPQSLGAVFDRFWREHTENWLDPLAQEYRLTYQRRLPNELLDVLRSLDTGVPSVEVKDPFSEDSLISESLKDVKSRLLYFLTSTHKIGSEQLKNIIENERNLDAETWYAALAESYVIAYGESMSETDQRALLKFAANDEFTASEIERRDRVRSKAKIASQLVHDFFTNQSKENEKSEQILFLLEEMEEMEEKEGQLPGDWKRTLNRKFRAQFSEELSDEIISMIGVSLQNQSWDVAIAGLEIDLPGMLSTAQNDQNVNLRKRRESVRKPITNKVKLLQLKQKLEAMKKGNKVEDAPLISNAGIIVGWVFWKSMFTQFDWLDDGKFKEVDDVHSSILAANWLHFSVGEMDSVNPLILAMCDVTEERYMQLSEEELESKMNGTNLLASVNDYYETILSMWPIFPIDQHQELIELFISREGILSESPIGRRLKMVKEPFDHLLNITPIPWPISIINFSWTSLIIEVEWN